MCKVPRTLMKILGGCTTYGPNEFHTGREGRRKGGKGEGREGEKDKKAGLTPIKKIADPVPQVDF